MILRFISNRERLFITARETIERENTPLVLSLSLEKVALERVFVLKF